MYADFSFQKDDDGIVVSRGEKGIIVSQLGDHKGACLKRHRMGEHEKEIILKWTN